MTWRRTGAGDQGSWTRVDADVQRLAAANAAAMARGLPHERPRRVLETEDLVAIDATAGPGGHSVAIPIEPVAGDMLAERLAAFYGPDARYVVQDHFDAADLSTLGYRRIATYPVMVRPPGPVESYHPDDFSVHRVDSQALLWHFEQVLIEAFPSASPPQPPPRLFDASVLDVPAARLWIGLRHDHPVATAMNWIDGRSVGIYWVATRRRHRGRGYGTVMTVAALRAAEQLPAVLTSTDAGERLYQRLGFGIRATAAWWVPEP